MKYDMTITAVALHPPGVNPIYGEGVIRLALRDEAGGYFLQISQITDEGEVALRVNPEELRALATLAKRMVEQKTGAFHV